MANVKKPRVVVVGAGVTGLTTALQLAESGKYDIAIVAKHMPGDYSIEYASPWAGADFLPSSVAGSIEEQYDRDTWQVLERLTREVPEAGIHFQETRIYVRRDEQEIASKKWKADLFAPEGPWYKDLMPDFRRLDIQELPEVYDTGFAFTSVCINVSLYLPWLAGQVLKHGIALRRGVLSHIAEARHIHPSGQPADVIINCTGLSSRDLAGVNDDSMYPARAQIAIVRNQPGMILSVTGMPDCPPDESCYIMQRAGGGGTILGGCYQKDDWNEQVDEELAQRIMDRAVSIRPALCDEPSLPAGKGWKPRRGVDSLSVVRHAVGLRPCRAGGIRIEAEQMENDLVLLHNYGHAGAGYQSSWGCAQEAVRVLEQALAEPQ